jgi:hypothetical protein
MRTSVVCSPLARVCRALVLVLGGCGEGAPGGAPPPPMAEATATEATLAEAAATAPREAPPQPPPTPPPVAAPTIDVPRVVLPEGFTAITDASAVPVAVTRRTGWSYPVFQTRSRSTWRTLEEHFTRRIDAWVERREPGSLHCTPYLAHPRMVSTICVRTRRGEPPQVSAEAEVMALDPADTVLSWDAWTLGALLVPGTDLEAIGRRACAASAPEAQRTLCAGATVVGVPGASGLELELIAADASVSVHVVVPYTDAEVALRADTPLAALFVGSTTREVPVDEAQVIETETREGMRVSFELTAERPLAELAAIAAELGDTTLRVRLTATARGVLLLAGTPRDADAWRALRERAQALAREHGGTCRHRVDAVSLRVARMALRGRHRELRARPDESAAVVTTPEEGTLVMTLHGYVDGAASTEDWVFVASTAGAIGWAHGGLDIP